MPIPASVRGRWSQGTLTPRNAPLTTRNDGTSGHPNVILETRTLPRSLHGLPPFLFCTSLPPGSLGPSTPSFPLFALFPAIASPTPPTGITLVGREGRLKCRPGSKVPSIGLGGKRNLRCDSFS